MKNLEEDILHYFEHFLSEQHGENYEYTSSNYETIEISAVDKRDKKRQRILIIKVGINHKHRQIYIPNIFIPTDMKHKGIGKKLIYIVYCVGVEYGYEVFVIDLTDGFRERLLKRGAGGTDIYDTLEITENTILI